MWKLRTSFPLKPFCASQFSLQAFSGVYPGGWWEDPTQTFRPKSGGNYRSESWFNRPNVNKICVSSQYHLRNIAKIRKYLLSEDTPQILVHAFLSSKLDNCNSLLYGLPIKAPVKQVKIDTKHCSTHCYFIWAVWPYHSYPVQTSLVTSKLSHTF